MMLSQLYWVGLTYVRRPLFWVATALLLAAVAYGILPSNSHRMRPSYPRFKVSGTEVYSYEEFQKLQAEGRLHEIRTLDIGRLLRDKKRHLAREIEGIDEINAKELIEECAQATEIEELEFASRLLDMDLDWLGKFPKLRHFEIRSYSGNKPWVAQLDQLSKLERLSITSCASLEGISRLANLEKLQTLKLEGIKQFSDADLREIAQLPHLQTLILNPHSVAAAPKPDDPKNSITDAGLALLRDMPNLQTVYVNPYALERVRSVLPHKRVLRSNYSSSRVGNMGRVEIALALFFAVVLFHFAGQSSLFLGRLAPRFLRGHWMIPAGMVVLAIALGTVCIANKGSNLLPALSVCLMVLAVMGLYFYLLLGFGESKGLVGTARNLSVIFGPHAVGFAQVYFAPTLDFYLLGDFPRTCMALLGLSCLTIFLVSRSLLRLPIRLAESGIALPVSLADIKSLAESSRKQKNKHFWPFSLYSNTLDRQIAQGFHGNQQAQRVSHWHAATPGMGGSQVMFFAFIACAVIGFSKMRKGIEPETILTLALLAPLTLGLFGLLGLSSSWHFRLKHFSYELLRPVSRRSLRSDFFRSLIGSLGNSLLLTLPLAMITYFYFRNAHFEIMQWIPSLCILSVGGLIFGVGVLASIALIRRSWLAMSLLVLLYFCTAFSLPFSTLANWSPPTTLLTQIALALGLLGAAALVYAWRRFPRIEWGKS